ncbi:MAG: diacylglycerol kinase family protein [Actinomycetia bacterium]|nr:diacylglycerol kinase family protein [Actinomycetes bacterium]
MSVARQHASPPDSFRFAARGFITALLMERNLYIAYCVLLAVIWASVYFKLSGGVLLAVLICCTIAISTELINTAFEVLVDLVSPEWNKQAGLVKDIAAAAEWFTALSAGLVGLIVFVPRLLRVGCYWPASWGGRAFLLLGLAVVLFIAGLIPGIVKLTRRYG